MVQRRTKVARTKSGPGEPGPYRWKVEWAPSYPSQGEPFNNSQGKKNCYNRAQLAGADEAR